MNRRQFLGAAIAAWFAPPLPAIETQPVWRVHGTVTGRMSSWAPNLSNHMGRAWSVADYAAADARMTQMIGAMFSK